VQDRMCQESEQEQESAESESREGENKLRGRERTWMTLERQEWGFRGSQGLRARLERFSLKHQPHHVDLTSSFHVIDFSLSLTMRYSTLHQAHNSESVYTFLGFSFICTLQGFASSFGIGTVYPRYGSIILVRIISCLGEV
jgi:hypothetical protein